MSDYFRGIVVGGEEVDLRVIFIDSERGLITPDALPVVYIYDESVETETIDAEMEAETYASAIAGPLTATLLSTGYYSYVYTVPDGAEAGVWHDVWVTQVNTVTQQQMLNFTVTETITIDPQAIGQNTMILVELADTIVNADGNATLEAIKLFYTTVYNPLYGSPDLVRAEIGPWLDYIPDDTLALMLHWSSKEAKWIQSRPQASGGNIELARTKFVVYDAALKALMQPGGGNVAGYTSGGKKSLGDLAIEQGNIVTAVNSGILDWIRKQRQEWWRVVNDGGNIVPGQGLGTIFAIKGEYDPDRRLQGRLWEIPGEMAIANKKVRQAGTRRGKWTYQERGFIR